MAYDPTALIVAGANLVGNIATNQINAERASSDMATYLNLVKKQRDWQKEDYAWSEDYTKRMMDYQFENFSSPSAQMDAYKKAGLNPWILGQNGSVGSGQGVSPASAPSPSRVGVSPFERSPLANPFDSSFNTLLQGSSVQNQRLAAVSELLKAAPDAFKALGKKTFDSVMNSLFGQIVDSSLLESISKNNELIIQHKEKVASIEAEISSKYGIKEAQNRVAIQEQTFNKMAAEIGLMSSEGRLNDAKIDELMSSYVRNLADSWKLKQEGNYFVANADTINAIRDLTVSSLEVELTKAGFENRIKGYYNGSGLDSYLSGSYHSGKTADILRIQENAEGSELVKALDRVLGKYLKVSAAP